jgi:hypothetical protein
VKYCISLMFKSMMVAHDAAEKMRRRKDLIRSSTANDYTDDDTQCRYGFIRVNVVSPSILKFALLECAIPRLCFRTF